MISPKELSFVFFKVSVVDVVGIPDADGNVTEGSIYYSDEDIIKISGVDTGDSLVLVSKRKTEEAIEKLLDKLSEDKQGIKELIKHSNAVIEICKNQYVSANAGMTFSKELLQRLSEFEIGIDIDTYICGKEFIS